MIENVKAYPVPELVKLYDGSTGVVLDGRLYVVARDGDESHLIPSCAEGWKEHSLVPLNNARISLHSGENEDDFECLICGKVFPGDYNRETGEITAVYGCDPCEGRLQ